MPELQYNKEQKTIIQNIIRDKINKTSNNLTNYTSTFYITLKAKLDKKFKQDKKLQKMIKEYPIKQKQLNQINTQIRNYVQQKYNTTIRKTTYQDSIEIKEITVDPYIFIEKETRIKREKLEELKSILLLETAGDLVNIESILKNIDNRITNALK